MRRQPRSGKRHVLRWVAVAAVVVVAGGTLGAYLKYRAVYDSITRVTVPSTALGHRPPVYSTTSENILVYGDDTRSGLTPHQQFVLHTGHDQTNNTDTIMVVHISPGHHGVTAVSIPRDTMVPEYECDSGPGYTGQQANPAGAVQINSLLQIGGPTCLWKTVEQMTGVRIDHFIGIGLLGFVKVVNDLGGVNVCVPFNVNDTVSGLNLKSGEQHITGVQALAFWRTRENLGDGSDLQRIRRGPGPHHQPGQRQGPGAERLRGDARRQPGGRRADQPRIQRDRDRRRPELRLHQVGHRVLHGCRYARGEHAHEAAHQRHLAAGA